MRIRAAIAVIMVGGGLLHTSLASGAHPNRVALPSGDWSLTVGSATHRSHYRAAIHWAERLYARNFPFPDDYEGMDGALDAFRQVKRCFPGSSRASIDIGRCYMALGRYDAAAQAFWQVGPQGTAQFKEANRRAKLSTDLTSHFSGRICLQVERTPGHPNAWIALLGTPARGEVSGRRYVVRPFLQFCSGSEGQNMQMGAVCPVHQYIDDGARTAVLAVTRLGGSRDHGAIVYQTFTAGDNDPNSQDVFRFTGRGLRHVGEFTGIENARVFLASKCHGLRLKVFATWKVGWPDVYEWRNGAFRFANRMNPELYKSDLGPYTSSEDYYPTWMERAALADVFGHFQRGTKLWRHAERLCLLSIRSGREWTFHGYSNRANLAEIRKRLGWLRQKRYNHWLLYRPYDAALFVPPYRLGSAFDDEH